MPAPSLLLTGGTGFFGTALLRERGKQAPGEDDLTILSRDPAKFAQRYPGLSEKATWIKGDIRDLPTELLGRPFTAVLHAAADSTSPGHLTNLERRDQIVEGTREMLEFAARVGARRFLLTSSGGVYGRQPTALGSIPEAFMGMPDPLVPANVYSVAKREAEHLCALYADKYGLEVVIARCFAFVGEDLPLNAHFAIGNFIRDALWADEVTVQGDGSQTRSYLDQRDLAQWLQTLLEQGQAGEAYNVGSDVPISIAELAHLVRDLISPDKPVRILGAKNDRRDRNRYIPDIGKIESHLGLRPTFSLEKSILDAAAGAEARGRPL